MHLYGITYYASLWNKLSCKPKQIELCPASSLHCLGGKEFFYQLKKIEFIKRNFDVAVFFQDLLYLKQIPQFPPYAEFSIYSDLF